jgi:uncharacterized membrane protein
MTKRPHLFTLLVLGGAALGLFFASFSTADFARHLDREVHSVSCSFTPGLSDAEVGASDCKTTMFSSYSSVLRTSVWGGVPISLPAISVFAFLLLFAIELVLTRRQEDPRAAGFLALATAVPAATSAVMAFISFTELDAACKLCIAIYASSAVVLVGGVGLWRRAVRFWGSGQVLAPDTTDAKSRTERSTAVGRAAAGEESPAGPAGEDPAWMQGASREGPSADPFAATMMGNTSERPAVAPALQRPAGTTAHRRPLPVPWGYLAAAAALGVALVAVPAFAYVALAPDHASYIGSCGELVEDKDPYEVMVPLDRNRGGVKAIELLDPLCPACRAFETRLEDSGLGKELDRSAMLFPLDSECNWMVSDRIHPGACAISEAVLCAGDRAGAVVEWAFAEQENIARAAASSGDPAREMAKKQFPELASCIGSAKAQSQLNKSLRWAVRNQLTVLTPQLFVEGVKLCDADTDLGLDFMLRRMIDQARSKTLTAQGSTGLASPGDTTPEAPTPADSAQAGSSSPETAPVETAPVETAPKETPPVETAPKETPPEETPPEETPPEETPPEETPPEETPPEETPPGGTP